MFKTSLIAAVLIALGTTSTALAASPERNYELKRVWMGPRQAYYLPVRVERAEPQPYTLTGERPQQPERRVEPVRQHVPLHFKGTRL